MNVELTRGEVRGPDPWVPIAAIEKDRESYILDTQARGPITPFIPDRVRVSESRALGIEVIRARRDRPYHNVPSAANNIGGHVEWGRMLAIFVASQVIL